MKAGQIVCYKTGQFMCSLQAAITLSLRQGVYRIVHGIQDAELIVNVTQRSEVYKSS